MATTKKKPLNEGTCKVKGCEKPRYCKAMCVAHYAAERRKDPVEREKAREASRRSAAKRREAKAGPTSK